MEAGTSGFLSVSDSDRRVPAEYLEKKMATHSSILAWEIPREEEPGGLQSTGVTEESNTIEATE